MDDYGTIIINGKLNVNNCCYISYTNNGKIVLDKAEIELSNATCGFIIDNTSFFVRLTQSIGCNITVNGIYRRFLEIDRASYCVLTGILEPYKTWDEIINAKFHCTIHTKYSSSYLGTDIVYQATNTLTNSNWDLLRNYIIAEE